MAFKINYHIQNNSHGLLDTATTLIHAFGGASAESSAVLTEV
jgi:hypothetical protein